MPAGTVYSKFEPNVLGEIEIKGESTDTGDFWSQGIADAIKCTGDIGLDYALFQATYEGASIELDFHCVHRDGLRDKDQMFAVWEHYEVMQLIGRLCKALDDSMKGVNE